MSRLTIAGRVLSLMCHRERSEAISSCYSGDGHALRARQKHLPRTTRPAIHRFIVKKYLSEDPRVVIAMPLAGPMIYWRTIGALLEMEKPSESDLMVFQGALVDRARNHLVEKMLDHPMEPTHLLFLDADILVRPNTLLKLLAHQKAIVSALYRKRLPPYEPMAFRRDRKNFKPISLKGRGLQSVDVVGSGCLLIRRDVLESIRPPWFTSDWREEGHLSEDFSFCEKTKKAGFDIYVDIASPVAHMEVMGIGTDTKQRVKFIPLDES